MPGHHAYRRITRTTLRSPVRCQNWSVLRGRWRGPDDLSQAFTALGRAIRASRRLARLAPRFFDSAFMNREAENRAEQRRWMATWEPALARVYGVKERPAKVDAELPPLPSARIQRKIEFNQAEQEMWMNAGRVAMERYWQRKPHAVVSLSRIVRLINFASDFGRLACGLEIMNPLPELITHDYGLTGLKRACGPRDVPTPPQAAVRVGRDFVVPSSPGGVQTPPAFQD